MPLPDVLEALEGLTDTIQFRIMNKGGNNFETVELGSDPVYFEGVLTGEDANQLEMMAEGQRRWNKWTLYTVAILKIDWLIYDVEGKIYRVIEENRWGTYFQYQLIENPII